MMYSMTAFGRGIHTAGGMTFTVEMRAVNGRYLERSSRSKKKSSPISRTGSRPAGKWTST